MDDPMLLISWMLYSGFLLSAFIVLLTIEAWDIYKMMSKPRAAEKRESPYLYGIDEEEEEDGCI